MTNILLWKITMLLMGKRHYFYGHVQVRKLLVYQRVIAVVSFKPWKMGIHL